MERPPVRIDCRRRSWRRNRRNLRAHIEQGGEAGGSGARPFVTFAPGAAAFRFVRCGIWFGVRAFDVREIQAGWEQRAFCNEHTL